MIDWGSFLLNVVVVVIALVLVYMVNKYNKNNE